ncbi:hypothetical protein GIB67_025467, partial [Kingdonia uniflora]
MISGYAKSDDVESAAILFSQMPSRDFITWTTMITCYSQNKQFKEAIDVFKEMIETPGVSPDEVIMFSVLSVCAHLGSLEMGRKTHNYLMQNRFDINVYIGSALVDMISGSRIWRITSDMFKKMEKVKIKPNGVTFISVLGACTHTGAIDVIPGASVWGALLSACSNYGDRELGGAVTSQ